MTSTTPPFLQQSLAVRFFLLFCFMFTASSLLNDLSTLFWNQKIGNNGTIYHYGGAVIYAVALMLYQHIKGRE
jgi:hypothetical protein